MLGLLKYLFVDDVASGVPEGEGSRALPYAMSAGSSSCTDFCLARGGRDVVAFSLFYNFLSPLSTVVFGGFGLALVVSHFGMCLLATSVRKLLEQ